MIITERKPIEEILEYLKNESKIFLVGCGECATTCKTGGECEVKVMLEELKKSGKAITGWVVPESPCVAAQIASNFAKHIKEIKEADSILALTCGLGVQSIKQNLRFDKPIHPALNTTFMGTVDKTGNLHEYCSACSDCVLEWSACICPITRCPKNLLNGPCGGPKDGKCEVDREKDCAWILIYNELKRLNKLDNLKVIRQPKDWSKTTKPHQLILTK
ncbi:MAG: methylenetetrahydrofolate reductase C-terminal domain-containing protein [Candidatus Omnitrophota bacterium]